MEAGEVKQLLEARYDNDNNKAVIALLDVDFAEAFCNEEEEFDTAWFVDFTKEG